MWRECFMMGTFKLNSLFITQYFSIPIFFTFVEFKNKTKQPTSCFSGDTQAAKWTITKIITGCGETATCCGACISPHTRFTGLSASKASPGWGRQDAVVWRLPWGYFASLCLLSHGKPEVNHSAWKGDQPQATPELCGWACTAPSQTKEIQKTSLDYFRVFNSCLVSVHSAEIYEVFIFKWDRGAKFTLV